MVRGPVRPPIPPRGAVLGLDEAGRGSLVGPLVAGGFLVAAERISELSALGVRDSKELTAARREAIFAALPHVGRPLAVPLPPSVVDRAVRRGRLNDLEIDAFAQMVRSERPDTVYVDACDPVAERFGRRLANCSGATCPIDARHHADRDLVVVGAASIVAKVLRDRVLARLRERLGPDLGSGYPSDESTVDFVRTTLATGGPAPSWLRVSWATSQRLMVGRSTRPIEAFGP